MFATTTGLSGKELDTVVQELQRHGWTYEAALTTRTNVLVAKPPQASAGPSSSSSPLLAPKVIQALKRSHTIAAVTLAWVSQGQCAKDRLREFHLHTELFGMRVSTTSLTDRQRAMVEMICQREASFYMTSLCRRCRFLVVSDEGTAPHNEKMLYAEKHPTIERVSFSTFVARFGRRMTTSTVKTSNSSDGHGGGGEGAGAVVVVGGKGGHGHRDDDDDTMMHVLARASSLAPTSVRLSHVVCYCTPTSLITPQVRRTLHEAQVHRVPIVTDATTHIVLLGPTSECIYPRPGLSFVSIRWLEACVRASEVVPEDIYRVVLPYCPTITFGSLSDAQRGVVRQALQRDDGNGGDGWRLPCHVQEMLLLGPRAEIASTVGGNALPTTHLVVPRACQASSRKVQAWAQRCRVVRRHECYLVDFEWIVASVEHGAWVDVQPYTSSYSSIDLPPPSPQRAAIASSRSNDRTSLSSARSSAVPHVVVSDGCQSDNMLPPPQRKHHIVVPDGDDDDAVMEAAGEGREGQRPSFDSQQLNLSLEVLVGKLEQRINAHHDHHYQHHQPPLFRNHHHHHHHQCAISAGTGAPTSPTHDGAAAAARCPPLNQPATFLAPPPLHQPQLAYSEDGASIGLPRQTESIMIGPSFGTGMSPLGSRDALGFPVATGVPPGVPTVIAAAVGRGGGHPSSGAVSDRHVTRQQAPQVESQLIVFQHHNMTQHQQQPHNSAPEAAMGGAVHGTADAVCVLGGGPLAPPPAARPMRLLLAKALRDDAASVQRLQALVGVRLVDVPEDATHYVVAKPSKTETFLCALAAGLWMLRPSFVAAFLSDGWSVKEEAHEWTAHEQQQQQQQQQRPSSLAALVDACVLQRRRGGGSFASWRCTFLTCSDAARAQSFARVLRCGGCVQVEVVSIAHILNVCSNLSALPQRPTHILTDDNLWDDAALARVEQALGTTVWRLEYLVHTLCSVPAAAAGGEGSEQRPEAGRAIQKREGSPLTGVPAVASMGDGFKARSMTLKKRPRE